MPIHSTANHTHLHFQVFGNGKETMLAFHGFGRTAMHWQSFSETLQDQFTIYAFDLPHHGEHKGQPGTIAPEEWKCWLNDFLTLHQITNFWLLAYSIGARFALETVHQMPDRVLGMVLLAPDGLRPSRWFRFATGVARPLFWLVMQNPKPLLMLAKAGVTLRLIHKQLLNNAQFNLSSSAHRLQVYRSWISFSRLAGKPKISTAIIAKNHIPVFILLGQKDRLIPPSTAEYLKGNTITTQILPQGHGLIVPQNARLISAWLNSLPNNKGA